MNKQIEELALDIHSVSHLPLELCGALATDLVETGYRKQSEGEWSRFEVNSSKGYGKVYYQHKDCDFNSTQLFPSPFPFCPNCGARMTKEMSGDG